VAKTIYIEYSVDQLNSVKISKRSALFVLKYLKLTRSGAASVSYTKDELKSWLFPISTTHANLVADILTRYDKARKSANKNVLPKIPKEIKPKLTVIAF